MTEQQIQEVSVIIGVAREMCGPDPERIWLVIRDQLPADPRVRDIVRVVIDWMCNPRDASEADATGTP